MPLGIPATHTICHDKPSRTRRWTCIFGGKSTELTEEAEDALTAKHAQLIGHDAVDAEQRQAAVFDLEFHTCSRMRDCDNNIK